MNTLRAQGSTYERLLEWFQIASDVFKPDEIKAYNIYNMEETGVMLGMLRTVKQVVATDVPTPYRRAPQTRESATVLECVAATGRAIKRMVIVKAKSHRNNWYPKGITGPTA